jgi:fructokinase
VSESRPGPIVALGEVLWDILPGGPLLGGAPFNALAHLQRLGRPTRIVSAVGDDELGRRAIAEIRALGVGLEYLSIVGGVPTGMVEVRLDASGTPSYTIGSPAAYECTSLADPQLAALARAAPVAVLFGTLAQRVPRVRDTLAAVVGATPDAALVYDVNLRRDAWTPSLVDDLLHTAHVLKLNGDEVAMLAPALDLPAPSGEAFARSAIERYDLRLVCITHGSGGAEGVTRDAYARVPGRPVTVADTVGAGDAFTAGLVDGLLRGLPLDDVIGRGNALAAIVASRAGAIPDWTVAELDRTLG